MRLNGATLAIIIVLAVVIGGALFLQNRPDNTEDDTPEITVTETSIVLFEGVTPDDVRTVTVVNNSGLDGGDSATIRLIREGDDSETRWVLDNDISTVLSEQPIVSSTVDTDLITLLELRSIDQFTEDNIAQFGLDAPDYIISFTTDDDEYALLVGNENPSGRQYYVQIEGNDTIYITSNQGAVDVMAQLVTDPPFEVIPTPTPAPILNLPGQVWQNFGYSFDFVNRITVTDNANDESVAFIRNEDNNVVELLSVNGEDPVGGDEITMRVVGLDIGGLTAIDALANVDFATLGLDEPQFTITAETENKTYTVNIGDLDPSQTRYYVQFDDSNQVAVVNRTDLDFILNTLAEPPFLQVETTPEALSVDVETTPEAEITPDVEETPEAEITPEVTDAPDATPTPSDD